MTDLSGVASKAPKPKSDPAPSPVVPISKEHATLIAEALRHTAVRERGGANRGKEVEEFQRAVDGKASGEAWCMCFVQFCVKKAEEALNRHSDIARSEHCLTVWNNTPIIMRRRKPAPGLIVIWKHDGTSNGHTGIITHVDPNGIMNTVEGNTGGGATAQSAVVREGDGVYRRARSVNGSGSMKIVGYIDPFATSAE